MGVYRCIFGRYDSTIFPNTLSTIIRSRKNRNNNYYLRFKFKYPSFPPKSEKSRINICTINKHKHKIYKGIKVQYTSHTNKSPSPTKIQSTSILFLSKIPQKTSGRETRRSAVPKKKEKTDSKANIKPRK